MSYRQSRLWLFFGIPFGAGGVWCLFGGPGGLYGAALWLSVFFLHTAYQICAIRNRRLVDDGATLTYFDWRGQQKLLVQWHEVKGLSEHVNGGEGGWVELKTQQGSINVLGLAPMDDLEKRVKEQLRDLQTGLGNG